MIFDDVFVFLITFGDPRGSTEWYRELNVNKMIFNDESVVFKSLFIFFFTISHGFNGA